MWRWTLQKGIMEFAVNTENGGERMNKDFISLITVSALTQETFLFKVNNRNTRKRCEIC